MGSGSFGQFYDSLPDILAADSLRAVARGVASAVARDREVVWMLGGHVVKTGLSVVLIDLMERGAVTHLAVNGATVIHDYETCRWGGTSEDVEAGLADGLPDDERSGASWFSQPLSIAHDLCKPDRS